MKTKFTDLLVVAIAMFAFAACNNNTDPEPVVPTDPRDAFVGTYDYESTGALDLDGGIVKLNIPLNDEGTFIISKVGDKEQVMIKGDSDSINATVSGNQLILELGTYHQTISSIDLQFTFKDKKATLEADTLTWESDIYGIGTYHGISADGDGHVYVTAIKQHFD